MPIIRKNRTPVKSMAKRKTQVRQRTRGFLMTTCDKCGRKVPSGAAKMKGHEVRCPACYRSRY